MFDIDFKRNKTYYGFEDVTEILDRKIIYGLENGISVKQKIPPSLKKSFSSGVIIPTGIRLFPNCVKSVDKFCDICRARTEQTKEYKANISELKRKPPNEHEDMLACYVTK